VNHKYSSFFKVIPEQFVGQGIRKTNSYESRLSKGEWIAKREEFWGTGDTFYCYRNANRRQTGMLAGNQRGLRD
jgi:hypothetical protein